MFRTALLLGLLTGILLAIGWLLGGTQLMTVFLVIAFIMNFAVFWYSDKIVLAMYRAKPVSKSDEPELHEIVEKLAKEAGIPKPKVYLVNLPVLNAFATGRSPKHSAVAVTSGLLKHLELDEIEGVVGHELSHIKSRDTLTSTIAATIAGVIAYIAQFAMYSLIFGGGRRQGGSLIFLPLIILAPIAAMIVQLAISRGREFAADKNSGIITRKPLSLVSALGKISKVAEQHPLRGNTATSHLFIINPFKGGGIASLFSTHPSVEERTRRLKELESSL